MRAIGVWGAVSGLAAALAPSLGALSSRASGWRAVFLINVPVALLALIAGRSWLSESRSSEVSKEVTSLVFLGFVRHWDASVGFGPRWDLGVDRSGNYVLCCRWLANAGDFFDARHHTRSHCLICGFGIRTFAIANVGSVFFLVAFFYWIIVLPEFVQETWGWSVLQSGFAIAPGPIVSTVLSVTNGRLADRIGPQRILVVGAIAGVGGVLLHFGYTGSTPSFFLGLLLPNLVMGVAAGCSLRCSWGLQCQRFHLSVWNGGCGSDHGLSVEYCNRSWIGHHPRGGPRWWN